MAGRRIRLLEADPSLLPNADQEAQRQLTAPMMRIGRGRWSVPEALRRRRDHWLGLLIVEGLMIRTIRVSELECCELVGAGDIIRPWEGGDDLAAIATGVSWRVVEPARVAILDDTFTRLACRWPATLAAIMERGLRRSRSLAVQLAIAQARRADVRLMALFWHLADRWGRVTPDGVLVELELTHGLLSRLTSLRRPTVSVTLKELAATGELTRVSKGCWLLRGARPSDRQRVFGLPVAA
jgi:CRP/FNR family transcriptional regulator, cyclic AMP receptor protein